MFIPISATILLLISQTLAAPAPALSNTSSPELQLQLPGFNPDQCTRAPGNPWAFAPDTGHILLPTNVTTVLDALIPDAASLQSRTSSPLCKQIASHKYNVLGERRPDRPEMLHYYHKLPNITLNPNRVYWLSWDTNKYLTLQVRTGHLPYNGGGQADYIQRNDGSHQIQSGFQILDITFRVSRWALHDRSNPDRLEGEFALYEIDVPAAVEQA